jgi:hypothetical protein
MAARSSKKTQADLIELVKAAGGARTRVLRVAVVNKECSL